MTFLDPVMVARQTEESGRLPFVFAEEFYLKYRELPDGKQEAVEWVMVTKKGMQNPQRTPMRIKDLMRDKNSPLSQVILPAYERWKAGQTAPINGTPLEAWIADAPLIKVLNSINIRSVEDLSEMDESAMVRMSLPGIREKKSRAKAFLEAQKSTAKVEREVSALRDKNESLQREIGELRALIEQHAIKQEPRRRGRPPKVQEIQ